MEYRSVNPENLSRQQFSGMPTHIKLKAYYLPVSLIKKRTEAEWLWCFKRNTKKRNGYRFHWPDFPRSLHQQLEQ